MSPPAPDASALPAWLSSALSYPSVEWRPWTWSLAPAYIGLFLWVVFFDQLPAETLARGSLAWAVFGCAVGGALAYLLFFLPLATWGVTVRRPMSVIASRTFGLAGAGWVPLLLLALIQVVWLAVAVRYGTQLLLSGLTQIHLLDPDWIQPARLRGMTWPRPVFAVTALVWMAFIALVGRYLVRVIAALMNVYPVVVALIVGAATLMTIPGLRGTATARPMLGTAVDSSLPAAAAAVVAVQMILGFFATAGLIAADWGAVCRDRSEVRKGGLVCVAMAGWIIATLAILTVTGARARGAAGTPTGLAANSFCSVLPSLFGPWIGGALLIALGLAALAPGCYAVFLIGTRMHELYPGFSRSRWTWIGAGLAWVLVMLGERVTLLAVFSVIGALVAPVAGAMSADFLRSGRRWPGPRTGANRAGLIAWVIGVVVGLAPLLADLVGGTALRFRQPAVLLAYLAAGITYYLLAAMGAESPTAPDLIPAATPLV